MRSDVLITLKIIEVSEAGVGAILVDHANGGGRLIEVSVGDTLELLARSRRPTLGITHKPAKESENP